MTTDTYTVDASGKANINKDINATLDYTFDWTAWLTDIADTIAGAPVWTVPAPLTKVSQSNTTMTATAFISGGVLGTKYQVECKITTAGGRVDERSIYIKITER